MVRPTPTPAAEHAAAATPRTSAETLLELQHELDIANDNHPAKRATRSPQQRGGSSKTGPGPAQAAPGDGPQRSEAEAPGAPTKAAEGDV